MADRDDQPAAIYAAIRERLDHPPVDVVDPCAPTLAPDDPDFPSPRGKRDLDEALNGLSWHAQLRCAVEAAATVLWLWETDHADDTRLRRALEQVLAMLGGNDDAMPDVTGSDALDILADVDLSPPARNAGAAIAYTAGRVRSVGTEGPGPLTTAILLASFSSHAAGARYQGRLFIDYWWARCRAVLPIVDVATAAIEWHDLRLPERAEP